MCSCQRYLQSALVADDTKIAFEIVLGGARVRKAFLRLSPGILILEKMSRRGVVRLRRELISKKYSAI